MYMALLSRKTSP